MKAHYVSAYGPQSKQVKDCSQGYHFEPSVGEKVLLDMLKETTLVTVLLNRQFDALPENLLIENNTIKSITVLNRQSQQKEQFSGAVFIDATYEGDLIAAAGVPYSLGREGKKEFNEPYAGQVYKLWLAERQEEGLPISRIMRCRLIISDYASLLIRPTGYLFQNRLLTTGKNMFH
ncbi:FAD-dependent oxidoreductase [Pseudobacter ginsenosidimutans]|uniref:FAD-dependent oxidoreductase n=1 Tax=Pseudobacter ginsenosidimutans TaxID=661488 RepID=UPI0021CFA9CD|nr:FAD-dependent oxidoreductase [Pseudobacter ginsenosidimutans]